MARERVANVSLFSYILGDTALRSTCKYNQDALQSYTETKLQDAQLSRMEGGESASLQILLQVSR